MKQPCVRYCPAPLACDTVLRYCLRYCPAILSCATVLRYSPAISYVIIRAFKKPANVTALLKALRTESILQVCSCEYERVKMGKKDPEHKALIPLVIPAYEPDERMTKLFEEFKEKGIHDVILIDDGSGEAYREVFQKASGRPLPTYLRSIRRLSVWSRQIVTDSTM